jgi:hypothetical protein
MEHVDRHVDRQDLTLMHLFCTLYSTNAVKNAYLNKITSLFVLLYIVGVAVDHSQGKWNLIEKDLE